MQVIEFPGDVMDASKDVKAAVVVAHGVAIAASWHHSLILHGEVLELTEAEPPQVTEASSLIFASEEV